MWRLATRERNRFQFGSLYILLPKSNASAAGSPSKALLIFVIRSQLLLSPKAPLLPNKVVLRLFWQQARVVFTIVRWPDPRPTLTSRRLHIWFRLWLCLRITANNGVKQCLATRSSRQACRSIWEWVRVWLTQECARSYDSTYVISGHLEVLLSGSSNELRSWLSTYCWAWGVSPVLVILYL